jgi:ABC-2 type transport system permease protein
MTEAEQDQRPALLTDWRRAVRAEWGKAWSVRAPIACTGAAVAVALMMGWVLANDFISTLANGERPSTAVAAPAEIAGQPLQIALVVAGAGFMLLTTAEFASGSSTSTFAAQPRRGTVLGAKAVVAAVLGFVSGALASAVVLGVVLAVLGEHAAKGGPAAPAVVLRSAVVWAVSAVLVTGLATIIRSGVATLAAVFVILVGLLALPSGLGRYLPAQAGLDFAAGSSQSYPYGVGLLVVAAWAAALTICAEALSKRRDL